MHFLTQVFYRPGGEATTQLAMESRIPAEVRQALAKQGHQISVAPAWAEKMGHAHAILVEPEGPRHCGDRRSDGAIACL